MLDKMRMFCFCSCRSKESSNPEDGNIILKNRNSANCHRNQTGSVCENFSALPAQITIRLDNGDKAEIVTLFLSFPC